MNLVLYLVPRYLYLSSEYRYHCLVNILINYKVVADFGYIKGVNPCCVLHLRGTMLLRNTFVYTLDLRENAFSLWSFSNKYKIFSHHTIAEDNLMGQGYINSLCSITSWFIFRWCRFRLYSSFVPYSIEVTTTYS